mmetsp:Transcript_3289/g.8494  ORF Transcript_3289/g.8494 Transcript_3289/m.8494 type:complete len:203 (-) Transcript_3289:3157-3765(-)
MRVGLQVFFFLRLPLPSVQLPLEPSPLLPFEPSLLLPCETTPLLPYEPILLSLSLPWLPQSGALPRRQLSLLLPLLPVSLPPLPPSWLFLVPSPQTSPSFRRSASLPPLRLSLQLIPPHAWPFLQLPVEPFPTPLFPFWLSLPLRAEPFPKLLFPFSLSLQLRAGPFPGLPSPSWPFLQLLDEPFLLPLAWRAPPPRPSSAL